MDRKVVCPDDYRDRSPEESVKDTRRTIEYIQWLDPEGRLVQPIVTPRFAPGSTDDALRGLGELAKRYNLPIQTHISENMKELDLIGEHFEGLTYAGVYNKYDLLTPRTILAHAVYLSKGERRLIRKNGSGIAHCPTSNSALASGICPVRTMLNENLVVGLGTDVSGGYKSSILEVVRQACLVSRLIGRDQDHDPESLPTPLSVEEALYLATRGGAKVVGLSEHIGGFEVGKYWDVQLIRLGRARSSETPEPAAATTAPTGDRVEENDVDIFDTDSWKDKVARWVWNGDDRNVRAVWVNGKLVHPHLITPYH
jgi:guanine deaminase